MPELPEVQTIVDGLNQQVAGATVVGVSCDWKKMISVETENVSPNGAITLRSEKTWKKFESMVVGKKIKNVERKGKFIVFNLSENVHINAHLIVHLRMTGHFLIITPEKRKDTKNAIHEKVNQYIHFQMELSDGRIIALSDLRKFAKIAIAKKSDIDRIIIVGQDPLNKEFTLEKFRKIFKDKRGNVKQILMDQSLIAGIGNIYSSEILWEAKISPLAKIENLDDKEMKSIFNAMKKVLKLAIKMRGSSESDYRDVDGNEGGYQKIHKVYKREGKECFRKDGGIIKRIKIGQRSTFYCCKCQI